MHYLAAAKKWSKSIIIAFGIFFSAVFVMSAIGYAVGFVVEQFTLPHVIGATAPFKCQPLLLSASGESQVFACGLGDVLINTLRFEFFAMFVSIILFVSPVAAIFTPDMVRPSGVLFGLIAYVFMAVLTVFVSKVFDDKEPRPSRTRVLKHIRQAWLVTFGLMLLVLTIIAIQHSIV